MRPGEQELRAAQVPFSATPEVAPVIAALGRTEDVRFSPDGRHIAIPEYIGKQVHVFGLQHRTGVAGREILIDRALTIRSSGLRDPHGVEFLGPAHLAVANRLGHVLIFRLPDMPSGRGEVVLTPQLVLRGSAAAPVEMPGSLIAHRQNAATWRLLICNNYIDTIVGVRLTAASLTLPRWLGARLVRNEGIVCAAPLDIPDGVAISSDGDWIAVSNHATGEALIFDAQHPGDPPVAALGGMLCPHGLRFSPSGEWLHVADAGAPYLCSYRRQDGRWVSVAAPARRVRILDEETFRRGHVNPLEGGIKGLDIDVATGVLALACEEQPLAFCDMAAVLDLPDLDVIGEIRARIPARDAAIRNTRKFIADKRAKRKPGGRTA